METDRYNPETDQQDYQKLIEIGVVQDESGKPIFVEPLTSVTTSVITTIYVGSGRGYFDVWKSHAQKAVRRCDPKAAIKALYEIYSMGGVFASNILNRFFQVMVSEDIGIAEQELPRFALTILQKHKARTLTKIELIQAVEILARARKSRYIDYLIHKVRDMSTDQLKEENILYSKVKLALLLENDKTKVKLPSDTHSLLKRRTRSVFSVWDGLIRNASERVRDQVLALLELYLLKIGEPSLSLVHAIVLVEYDRNNLLSQSKLPSASLDVQWEEITDWTVWPYPCSYDKHTRVGKKLKCSRYEFYRYGGKIANAVPEYETEEVKLYQSIVASL